LISTSSPKSINHWGSSISTSTSCIFPFSSSKFIEVLGSPSSTAAIIFLNPFACISSLLRYLGVCSVHAYSAPFVLSTVSHGKVTLTLLILDGSDVWIIAGLSFPLDLERSIAADHSNIVDEEFFFFTALNPHFSLNSVLSDSGSQIVGRITFSLDSLWVSPSARSLLYAIVISLRVLVFVYHSTADCLGILIPKV
jgi:hypothetical protein